MCRSFVTAVNLITCYFAESSHCLGCLRCMYTHVHTFSNECGGASVALLRVSGILAFHPWPPFSLIQRTVLLMFNFELDFCIVLHCDCVYVYLHIIKLKK